MAAVIISCMVTTPICHKEQYQVDLARDDVRERAFILLQATFPSVAAQFSSAKDFVKATDVGVSDLAFKFMDDALRGIKSNIPLQDQVAEIRAERQSREQKFTPTGERMRALERNDWAKEGQGRWRKVGMLTAKKAKGIKENIKQRAKRRNQQGEEEKKKARDQNYRLAWEDRAGRVETKVRLIFRRSRGQSRDTVSEADRESKQKQLEAREKGKKTEERRIEEAERLLASEVKDGEKRQKRVMANEKKRIEDDKRYARLRGKLMEAENGNGEENEWELPTAEGISNGIANSDRRTWLLRKLRAWFR